MSLAERRWLRLFTLTVLFFAQGIPWGFMAIELPAYLAGHGVGQLGRITAMTTLPFAFKFVWGPAIDAFTIPRLGRRRPWIIFAQGMMALTVVPLAFVGDPAASFDWIVWLVFAHTVFNAMQNVAVDALAIDLLDKSERGRANGFMYGAKYAGGALGAAAMAWLIEATNLRAAVLVQAAVLGAITLVPLLVRESDTPPPPHTPLAQVPGLLREAFRSRPAIACAVLTLLLSLATGMLSAVAPSLFMGDLHWKDTEYSAIAGGFGLPIGFAGSIVAGFLSDKLGRRRLVALACAVMAGGWLLFALSPGLWNDRTFVYVLFGIEPLTQSIMIVAVWSVCMDATLPKTAATQFAVYTSLINLSSTIGSKYLADPLSGVLSYQALYILAAIMQVALIALLPLCGARRAPPR